MNDLISITLPATGEREPGGPPLRVHAQPSPGSRLRPRYVTGQDGGYNPLDAKVLDTEAPAGQRLVCRATASNARLICFALNLAIPT
jgi:hypothetical protein